MTQQLRINSATIEKLRTVTHLNTEEEIKSLINYMNLKFREGIPKVDEIRDKHDSPWHRIASFLNFYEYKNGSRLKQPEISQLEKIEETVISCINSNQVC
mgnify:CR=1 FL=1